MCEDSINWMNLLAYAPYNIVWDLNLHTNNYENYWTVTSDKILNNTKELPWYCTSTSIQNSFCEIDENTKWVIIDDAENDDFIKYSNLDLNWDFVIEMNVKVPTDSDKHYLVNSWNDIKLFIREWKLYFNDDIGDNSFSWLSLWAW
jgi:hypothetical protein